MFKLVITKVVIENVGILLNTDGATGLIVVRRRLFGAFLCVLKRFKNLAAIFFCSPLIF
jgi:hypothetical protein